MKKKIVFSFILGILISSVAYAAVSLSSDKISYKDTTVEGALDNLFDESASGKTKIAEAITNKGIETLDTDSYDTMVSNINNISTENPYLKYNEESGYIQVKNVDGEWVSIYQVNQIPIPIRDSLIPLLASNNSNITATSSYTNRPGYLAFDGNDVTCWSGASGTSSSALTYQFDSKVSISKLKLITEGNGNSTSCTFYVDVSSDNSTWTTIWSKVMGADTTYNNEIELSTEIIARYIRFRMTGVNQGAYTGAGLRTLQAYGYVIGG